MGLKPWNQLNRFLNKCAIALIYTLHRLRSNVGIMSDN